MDFTDTESLLKTEGDEVFQNGAPSSSFFMVFDILLTEGRLPLQGLIPRDNQ